MSHSSGTNTRATLSMSLKYGMAVLRYTELIGAFICGFFYFRHKGYSFLRLADICAPGLIAGQMIGRWGNFVNQEAYGGPVSEDFF